jgi:hypothetical protein
MLDIPSVLATIRRYRIAFALIAIEVALACAVFCNVIGRGFNPDEVQWMSPELKVQSAILSEAVARQLFPGKTGLGETIYLGDSQPVRVVGIVERPIRPYFGFAESDKLEILGDRAGPPALHGERVLRAAHEAWRARPGAGRGAHAAVGEQPLASRSSIRCRSPRSATSSSARSARWRGCSPRCAWVPARRAARIAPAEASRAR